MSSAGAERAARRIAEAGYLQVPPSKENLEKIAAIISEETGTQWISVSERLPELGQEVLSGAFVTSTWSDGRQEKNWQQTLMIWTGKQWLDSDSGEEDACSHWQPLPPAPEEGGKR